MSFLIKSISNSYKFTSNNIFSCLNRNSIYNPIWNINLQNQLNSFTRNYTTETKFTTIDINSYDSKKLKNVIRVGLFKFSDKDLTLDKLVESIPSEILENGTFYRDTKRFGNYLYKISFTTPSKAMDFYNHLKSITEKDEKVSKLKLTYPFVNLVRSSMDRIYNITDEEIEKLPIPQLNTQLTIVKEQGDIDNAVRLLLNGRLPNELIDGEEMPVLGFDCEWPGLRKFLVGESARVSLIQLSTDTHTCLFRVNLCGLDRTSSLGRLLLSDKILKVGHGIGKDANKIQKDWGFLMENIGDIFYLPIVQRMINRDLVSVAAVFDQVNLKKNRTTLISNWATTGDLTNQQIQSSAKNAYYARHLYFKLKDMKPDVDL
ncbi:hypothetical protein DLAC_08140 [Tieghemostelium lacteum]|uniref:3'-5' exonuclease n=1 Tax=Tieghemostelium lacteum TaxID=361077 RepID=A0A151ZBF7_TIELA|nr:hypothetical protein DLAC_08140 [Tieghemostelium lacteum]|eukprot:KYQ91214.1 hypothetical protein DLAC_08140 [Tieghemostelium lacteum]